MSFIRIATFEDDKNSNVIAGNELGSAPAKNILNPYLNKVWRTASLGGVYAEIELPSSINMNQVALLATNAKFDTDLRIRTASSQSRLLTNPSFDTGVQPHWPGGDLSKYTINNTVKKITLPSKSVTGDQFSFNGRDLFSFGAADLSVFTLGDIITISGSTPNVGSYTVSGNVTSSNIRVDRDFPVTQSNVSGITVSAPPGDRWVRIDILGNNSDGYYECGRVHIAEAWVPIENMSFGWTIGWKDPSQKERSPGGRTFSLPRARYRVLDVALNFLDKADAFDNAFEIDRIAGTTKDVLVIKDIDDSQHLHNQMIYGLMSDLPPIGNHNAKIYSKRYRIEEEL